MTIPLGVVVGAAALGVLSCGSSNDGGACAAQDVAGSWSLTYEPTGDGCHSASPPSTLTLSTSASGLVATIAGMQLEEPDVVFRPETCAVEAKWSWSRIIGGERNGETGDLTLRFAGDRGSGSLDYCTHWTCSYSCVSGTWSVTAQR